MTAPPLSAAVSPPSAAGLSDAHFTALDKLLGAFPVGDLIALIQGRATTDTVIDLAEQAASLVAAAFPPAAITAGEVGLALEALRFLLDAASLGASPFRITPGENPLRGGLEGARGRI